AATPRPRSERAFSPLRSSRPRSPVIAMVRSAPLVLPDALALEPSAPLRLLGRSRLAGLPDHLHVLWRLHQRLEFRLGRVFRLLFGFPVGAISWAHLVRLHVAMNGMDRPSTPTARHLHRRLRDRPGREVQEGSRGGNRPAALRGSWP